MEIFKIKLRHDKASVLVTNKDGNTRTEQDASPEVVKLLEESPVMFVWGTVNEKTGQLEMVGAAPWQEW